MSKRLKEKKKSKGKLKEVNEIYSCGVSKKSTFFSLEYMTNNKKHTFDFFDNDLRKKGEVSISFVEKLREISRYSWEEFYRKPKETGCERLYKHYILRDIFQNIHYSEKVSQDTKLIVFRFHQQNYRFIGLASKKCDATVYIIGFDFNYKLYRHQ